jgi:hypothetical protein
MRTRMSLAGVGLALMFVGCTFANPGFIDDYGANPVADLTATVNDDLGESQDLSVPWVDDLLTPLDFTGSTADLTAPPDLLLPPPDLMASCGAPGEPCCATANSRCRANGCCSGGTCLAEGQRCSATEVCRASSCTGCGGAGQPCCDPNACGNNGCCLANDSCVANGTGMCIAGVMCNNGSCGTGVASCGGQGQACCPNPTVGQAPVCTAPTTYCINNVCQHCGAPGEHCCNGNQCANGCCAIVNNQYTCIADNKACFGTTQCTGATSSCSGCGGLGQACCVNGTVTFCSQADTRCNASTCESCGGLGQGCCPPNNFCAAGRSCNAGTCG